MRSRLWSAVMPIRSFLAGQAFGAEIISEIEYGAQGAPWCAVKPISHFFAHPE